MNTDYTRIAIILDKSGSMSGLQEATITSFNDLVRDQKTKPGQVKLKLIQFDDQYETSFDEYLDKVPDLTASTYMPRGSTALYDAQARTIRELGQELSPMKEEDRPSKVMVVTITDGHENASKEFSQWNEGRERLAAMIKEQTEKYSWDFVFLAANQDAVKVANQFNVMPTKAMTFGANKMDVQSMTRGLNSYMSNYRSFASASEASVNSSFSDEERNASVKNAKESNETYYSFRSRQFVDGESWNSASI